MKPRAVCLLSRVGGAFLAEGTGYSKVGYLAKGRTTPRRNWKKAPEAEVQLEEQVGADQARMWVFILRGTGSLLRSSKQGGEMITVVV